MTIDEFRNALRTLLNDAARSGLSADALLSAADELLHPEFDLDEMLDGVTPDNLHPES